MVNNCTGDCDICATWKSHYDTLLNSIDKSHGSSVLNFEKLSKVIIVTRVSIAAAFKSLKFDKASGADRLAAELFINAHDIIQPILSSLFAIFIRYGYICLLFFVNTALVYIIKIRHATRVVKNNYKPIALVTALSKLFEPCLLEFLAIHHITDDH